MSELSVQAPALDASEDRPRPRIARRTFLRELVSTLVFGVAVFTLLQLSIPQSRVQGHSMDPTLAEGQRLIVSRLNYLFGDPARGDIIVFNSPRPREPNEPPLIKRVIGVPGDRIEIIDRQVYVNGGPVAEPYINGPCQRCRDGSWELGADEYFVMGDNRDVSNDSRAFGPVRHDLIIGEAVFRIWPLDVFGLVRGHSPGAE
jgi:signal peptidase I